MTAPWTDAEIHASLDLQAAVPGVLEHFARFKRDSAAMMARHRVDKHFYGSTPAEYWLEVAPTSEAPASPLAVFIHGGYWRAFTADELMFVAEPILAQDMRFLSINYALCPAVSFTTLVDQVLAAVDAIAARFSGRPIWLIGHSAGAHLAMMACRRDLRAPRPPIVRASLVSGIYDLAPVARSFLQGELHLTAPEVRGCSPLYAPADLAVHYHLLHGQRETPIFCQQSHDMASALSAQGATVRSDVVAAVDHFEILSAVFDADGPMLAGVN
jgi:arylformamidase